MMLMATHGGVNYLESTSSIKSNSERGASSYESDTTSKVHNLHFDKIYDAIKMISRSLHKIRNKYFDLK